MNLNNLGNFFLVVFLILTGIMLVTNIEIVAMNVIRGISALAAGILLLVGK